jgi:hypothetical protein
MLRTAMAKGALYGVLARLVEGESAAKTHCRVQGELTMTAVFLYLGFWSGLALLALFAVMTL